ncbi:MAG: phosphate ABC transporter permease subunit PstC [Rhodospirillaceae bacterium]|nr:phosphate ABC transporter permease subunit PstC [Rhodospirillales bacterium]
MDGRLRAVLWVFAVVASSIIALIIMVVAGEALPAFRAIEPWRFLGDASWHPAHGAYNLAPMIIGTFVVAGGAVVVGAVLGLLSAIFCCFYAPKPVSMAYRCGLEMLAGIPSVVLGLWGLTVLVPVLASLRAPGFSVLAAIVVLGLMVVPTIALVAISSLRSVPVALLLGSQALGLSKWMTIARIAFPAARAGLISSVVLGIGRALGETMAVMMVSGNIVQVPASVFEPVRTLAANIALEIPYAEQLHRSSLFVSGLILALIILVVLCVAEWFGPEPAHD